MSVDMPDQPTAERFCHCTNGFGHTPGIEGCVRHPATILCGPDCDLAACEHMYDEHFPGETIEETA